MKTPADEGYDPVSKRQTIALIKKQQLYQNSPTIRAGRSRACQPKLATTNR
jgi:hypothetical protein